MKQKEKTQVVKIRIKMDITYDPAGLEGITGQSMNKSGLVCLITDNTAIPCRHKLPKLIPHDLTSGLQDFKSHFNIPTSNNCFVSSPGET